MKEVLVIRQPPPGLGEAELLATLEKGWQALSAEDWAGKRVALAVGSRGIKNLPLLVTPVVRLLREGGAEPFVLAAMGSHGGGTIPGQLAVLAALGITPETVGAPVEAAEEWAQQGEDYLNPLARDADAIILLNRLKPHTSFSGALESGLAKLLVVGLGGVPGAKAVHARRPSQISPWIEAAALRLLLKLPVRAGVAVVENQDHQTALLEVLPAETMLTREKELLTYAREMVPRIPVPEADLLVVEEIGKCFAGTGMDTHVISRQRIAGEAELPERFRRIIAVNFAAAAQGNA